MVELLFDVAWWLPLLVAALGAALLVAGNNRQQSAMRNAGAAVVLLGLTWLALSFIIDTPTKVCTKRTRQLVQAFADGDWKTYQGLTAANVAFRYVGRPWQVTGRAALEAEARETVKQAGLHAASMAHVQSKRDGDKIQIAFTAYIDSEITPGHPIDSDWEFDWRQDSGQWKLAEMRVLNVANTSPESIKQTLNKR